jgi:hypothetical protein
MGQLALVACLPDFSRDDTQDPTNAGSGIGAASASEPMISLQAHQLQLQLFERQLQHQHDLRIAEVEYRADVERQGERAETVAELKRIIESVSVHEARTRNEICREVARAVLPVIERSCERAALSELKELYASVVRGVAYSSVVIRGTGSIFAALRADPTFSEARFEDDVSSIDIHVEVDRMRFSTNLKQWMQRFEATLQ